MRVGFLIIFLTLAGARKEAAKRWPAPAQWTLKVDQSKTTYVYELEIDVLENRPLIVGYRCAFARHTFKGKDWQAVMDASKLIKSTCVTQ